MGREIRMVPPNYEHPRKDNGDYESLSYGFEKDLREFEERIASHGLRDTLGYYGGGLSPEDYMLVEYKAESEGGDGCYYGIPEEECTWRQVFENVSEGSPDTPPFETKEELIEYLCTEGSLHHNEYPDICPILTRPQAEAFVKYEHAVSFVVTNGVMKTGQQACEDI